jgi:hypothetical protein
MYTYFARAGLVPVVLLAAALFSPAAAQQQQLDDVKLVRQIYAVADLVIPVDRAPRRITCGSIKPETPEPQKAAATADPTREAKLIRLITDSIQPQSWSTCGGPGTINYCGQTMSLVINHTPDVQEQVANLLAALRRLMDEEVAVEVRFLSVAADFLEHCCAKDCPLRGALQRPIALDGTQLACLLEAVQADVRTNVMQAPKLTLFSGQCSILSVGDERKFVTGISLIPQEGGAKVTPKVETLSSGVELSVRPVISADRRFVRMNCLALLKSIDTPVPVFPVNVPILPAGSDEKAPTTTFTQFIQLPKVQTLVVDKTFVVADGHTMLLDAGTRISEGRKVYGPSVLSEIPYLGRLFKNVCYGRELEHVLLMVTPRIIVRQEEELKMHAPPAKAVASRQATDSNPVPAAVKKLMKHFSSAYKAGKYQEAEVWAQLACQLDPDDPVASAAVHIARLRGQQPAPMPPVARCVAEEGAADCQPAKEWCPKLAALLAKYEAACAAGRLDEARQCAAKALALDPTCFRKGPVTPSMPGR